MAPRMKFPLLHFLSIVVILCFVVEQPSAFTINLIHQYAHESPFYNANLTTKEITERLNFPGLDISTRKENRTLFHLNVIRPHLAIDLEYSAFLVNVSLGIFSSEGSYSHKSYYLDPDTGSGVTWLQCEDCMKDGNQCYPQIQQPYPNSKSMSYRPLPCGRHPLCFPDECIEDSCSYHVEYDDDSHSVRILAREIFAFPSSSSHEEILPIVFGCGIDNKRSYARNEEVLKMAGVLGMGWSPLSFVNQIHSISQGRFSYCFPPASEAVGGLPIFLRFGSDIHMYSNLPGTRLIRHQGNNAYFVNLLDISINGVKLNILSSYFQRGGPNVGGCIFDTGSARTYIWKQAYRIFRQAMKMHIARSKTSLKMIEDEVDLCYMRSRPFRGLGNLPSVTFHFEGNADLEVRPEASFFFKYIDTIYEHVCLAMRPYDEERLTIIGSITQANQFMVYDLPAQKNVFRSSRLFSKSLKSICIASD